MGWYWVGRKVQWLKFVADFIKRICIRLYVTDMKGARGQKSRNIKWSGKNTERPSRGISYRFRKNKKTIDGVYLVKSIDKTNKTLVFIRK